MSSRFEKAARDIVPGQSRGLEIGPLHAPLLRKEQFQVWYVDHATTEELRAKYGPDPNVDVADIVEVDFVWDGSTSLFEVTRRLAPFDFVVASHVLEHIPNPIRWLREIGGVLRPGGILTLFVPDKRFTFDYNRGLSDVSDLIEAYLEERTRPSLRQIYEFEAKNIVTPGVDVQAVWSGRASYENQVRTDVDDPDVHAYNTCLMVRESGAYVDVHTMTYTPDSFLEIVFKLGKLGLLDYAVRYFEPTKTGEAEFLVTLERSQR